MNANDCGSNPRTFPNPVSSLLCASSYDWPDICRISFPGNFGEWLFIDKLGKEKLHVSAWDQVKPRYMEGLSTA